ncbi:MAG TPA: carboxypeptidase-like regulatory domain-containing protein [Catalimonadaceae bacterium]|nr:carboxypeptidase-like regulatory domain-containing protein [Catalimonadaceae bacterium]HPI11538.1 carboxypeptidase-like regulatory domain-containing protein [Catalimonadaceae bacterium]
MKHNPVIQLIQLGFIFLLAIPCFSQRKVIQFSGLIVSGEQSYGVPYASVYVPRTTRGAVTNDVGYFSFPLLIGDTCIVRSQGFRPQKYIIPDDGRVSISVVLYLQSDTTLLPEVEILPFPTEADFKKAFLALRLPESDMNRMRKNLDANVLARMQYNLGLDGRMNHMYFVNQQSFSTVNQNFIPNTTQILNPFAWGQFIKSVKKGEADRRKREEDED